MIEAGDVAPSAAGVPRAVPPVVARQRNLILAVLLLLAAVGWVVFLHQATEPEAMAGSMQQTMGPDLTMGHDWPLFMGMWVAMMAAMMFPAAAPMVLMYGRMRSDDRLSIVLFGCAYIGLWVTFGVAAYLLSAGVESLVIRSYWVAANWGRAGGALLAVAGAYQLSPLKDICLRQCRTPMSFVMTRWRDGRSGAVRMGLLHGTYCVGCCWLLFLILVPVGVMNVAAMTAVAALVFAEKVLPIGRAVCLVAAILLVVYGVAVASHPAFLPTVAS